MSKLSLPLLWANNSARCFCKEVSSLHLPWTNYCPLFAVKKYILAYLWASNSILCELSKYSHIICCEQVTAPYLLRVSILLHFICCVWIHFLLNINHLPKHRRRKSAWNTFLSVWRLKFNLKILMSNSRLTLLKVRPLFWDVQTVIGGCKICIYVPLRVIVNKCLGLRIIATECNHHQ